MPKPPDKPPEQQLNNSKGHAGQLSVAANDMSAAIASTGDPGMLDLWHVLRCEINRDIKGHKSRGRTTNPETIEKQRRAFELLDDEVAAGRDPEDKKVAGAIGNLLATDPNTIRCWRKQWRKEHGRN